FNTPCFQFVRAAKKRGIKTVFFTWENILRGHNPVYTAFEKYVLENSDAAVAGNKEAEEILKTKGFKKEIKTIPQYGLNSEDFTAEEKTGPVKIVLYAGRLAPEKGVETLIKAAAEVPGITVDMAGTGDAEYTLKLKKTASDLGMGERVVFHGHCGRREIADIMARADILVIPSLTTPNWKEQFGRVIIEAFASKTAVIGSSSGEIPNVIGDAGIVFKEGDDVELRDVLKRLVSDPAFCRALAEKGHKRVMDNFTNKIIASRMSELFLDVVNAGSGEQTE
ncbi:MAG TPA: glycosyltransferase family 1 protein, partial [Firmicutes bacterium]|nr:glycosyltransferase family 1 protein [Bacillota bacterium]